MTETEERAVEDTTTGEETEEIGTGVTNARGPATSRGIVATGTMTETEEGADMTAEVILAATNVRNLDTSPGSAGTETVTTTGTGATSVTGADTWRGTAPRRRTPATGATAAVTSLGTARRPRTGATSATRRATSRETVPRMTAGTGRRWSATRVRSPAISPSHAPTLSASSAEVSVTPW